MGEQRDAKVDGPVVPEIVVFVLMRESAHCSQYETVSIPLQYFLLMHDEVGQVLPPKHVFL